MGRIDGKTALVTGASRGIGAAVARQAAVNGARVGLNYFKSRDEAESLADELGFILDKLGKRTDRTSCHMIFS